MGNTSIICNTDEFFVYGGELWNGCAVRKLSLIVVYDEHGPYTTNYTASGCGTWTFETKRRISTRAVERPDWENKSGFIIKDEYNQYYGGYTYTLFINRDNIRDDDYVEGKWEKYNLSITSSVSRTDTIGGCKFLRIVENDDVSRAKDAVSDAMEAYDKLVNGNSHIAISRRKEVVERLHAIETALERYDVCHESCETLTVEELVERNGANGPVNANDYCGIVTEGSSNFRPYLPGTYEV